MLRSGWRYLRHGRDRPPVASRRLGDGTRVGCEASRIGGLVLMLRVAADLGCEPGGLAGCRDELVSILAREQHADAVVGWRKSLARLGVTLRGRATRAHTPRGAADQRADHDGHDPQRSLRTN